MNKDLSIIVNGYNITIKNSNNPIYGIFKLDYCSSLYYAGYNDIKKKRTACYLYY